MGTSVKCIVTIIISFLCIGSNAQTFGLRAGINLAGMSNIQHRYPSGGIKLPNPGIHLGMNVEFPITESLSLESGLQLTQKGVILWWPDGDGMWDEHATVTLKYVSYYMEIPLTIKVSKISKRNRLLYGEFGSYIGYGLIEIIKKKSVEDHRFTQYYKWENDSRLDYGITIGSGLYIKTMRCGAAFDLGLARVGSVDYIPAHNGDESFEGRAFRNRVLRVYLVYIFGQKPRKDKYASR